MYQSSFQNYDLQFHLTMVDVPNYIQNPLSVYVQFEVNMWKKERLHQ